MSETLIEKLEALKQLDPGCPEEWREAHRTGINDCIVAIRQHVAEPLPQAVERVANAINMTMEGDWSKWDVKRMARAAITAYQQAILKEPGHE